MYAAPAFAPPAEPISTSDLDLLANFIHSSQRLLCISGAGASTESLIPDYRGIHGAYTSPGWKPMTHQQFMATEKGRKRYWARSFAGWPKFSGVQPNDSHFGVARLQHRGWISHVLTQNVDRLHQKAGSTDVLELHGTTHRVRCMNCSWTGCRHAFQDVLARCNPHAVQLAAEDGRQEAVANAQQASSATENGRIVQTRPDGDVDLAGSGADFIVPPCEACGGVLKPDVVFFGDSVPAEKAKLAAELVQQCDSMLLLGTSVSTLSVFRLVQHMHKAGKSIGAVNIGGMRADALLDFKVGALAGEAMMRLACHPSLLMPRPIVPRC